MFKKIDIFLKQKNGYFKYECSTNAFKTCKEAKENYIKTHYILAENIKVNFAKR